MTVGIISTRADLSTIRDSWDRLAVSPVQSFAWIDAWLETLGRNWRPHVFVLGEADAIAPLAVAPGPQRRMEQMTVSDLFEPLDFLGDDAGTAELGRALVASGRPFILRRMSSTSSALAAVDMVGGRLAVKRGASPYTVVRLDESWTDPLSKLNSGRRSDLRRARRRAEQAGELRVVHASPSAEEADAAFDEFCAVEARSWKGETRTALAYDEGRAAFYRAYARTAAAAGALRTTRLYVDDRAIGAQLAVDRSGSRWILKIGFDAEFARASPGMLLTLEAIACAADDGCATYEFLGSAEDWTRVWSDELREFGGLAHYPPNVPGALAFAVDTARRARAGYVAARAAARRPDSIAPSR